jgi:hypothetical protein
MWFEKALVTKKHTNHDLGMMWYFVVGEVALFLMTNQINQ